MTIQDLGSIGEFVAALASLTTLVYLAIQVKSNTKTSRGNTHRATATAWSELAFKIGADAELSAIYHLGRTNPEKLSKEDRARFNGLVDAQMSLIENIWIQYNEYNLFAKSNQDRFDLILSTMFLTPGIQQYWSSRIRGFIKEFRCYIETELALKK
ncbi:MAG: hypothetical protein ISR27_05615 [Pseudomonadales bacterium]|nr:hypothetical protein [Pseudomonadales bacterium]